jgi:hypothetical protein
MAQGVSSPAGDDKGYSPLTSAAFLKNCCTKKLLELVLIGFVHGFSSIILTRARRKSESILSYGELFQRSNRQNLPKRQVQ